VFKIDLDAGKNVVGSAQAFTVPDSCDIIDGLAFDARNVADPTDDVFYYSDDCWTLIVDVYNLNGVKVDSLNLPALIPGFGAHNSGLAVGGQFLYVVDMFNSKTYVLDKMTKLLQFSFSTAVPGDPQFHPEDEECDTNTFAGQGKHVTWSKEAYSPARAHAFEIPFGSCGVGGVPAIIRVRIDIKPGFPPPAPINPRSLSIEAVAVLSDPNFNAPSQVDKTSLTFGRTGDEKSLAFCDSTPGDVNNDGRLDLVCYFWIRKANFKTGDTEGILKGKTVAGTPIEGRDAVRIAPTWTGP